MSKTLQGSKLKYHIIEKEAMAIVEVVQKWSHYLTHQHFTLISYQRSVAFTFSNEKHTEIKNAKIQEWQLELSSLDYTIKYCPGEENVVPDTLSRAYTCSLINSPTFVDLHNGLCHSGITWLLHFVREKNFPFSTEEVKKSVFFMQNLCRVKPCFYIPPEGTLIKAPSPWKD